jgi:hypothetical protein
VRDAGGRDKVSDEFSWLMSYPLGAARTTQIVV